MKGHNRKSTAKNCLVPNSFYGDIFLNWLKGWKSILESYCTCSSHVSEPSQKPCAGAEGVRRHWDTDTSLEDEEHLLVSVCWCHRQWTYSVCQEGEIWDHFLGVAPSCTPLGRWVGGHAHGEICCSVHFLCCCGLQKQYPEEQRLQVKQTSLTIVRKISRHIISCECRIPDSIIAKGAVVIMFLAQKGMKELPYSWKTQLLAPLIHSYLLK